MPSTSAEVQQKSGERPATRVVVSQRSVSRYRFALVTFTPEARSLVTWTAPALTDLIRAVRSIDTATVDAVVFCAEGPVFGAGADLSEFRASTAPEHGVRIGRAGYAALNEISALGVPTFAVLQGAALGGGLELALRADYRIAGLSVRAIGLPEVRLGLLPGWGGLSFLSRLIGVAPAAEIGIVQSLGGRQLSATEAAKIGVVDAVLADEGLLDSSLAWAVHVLDGALDVPERPTPAAWDPASVRRRLGTLGLGTVPAVEAALAVVDLLNSHHAGEAARPASPESTRTARRLDRGPDPVEAHTVDAFAALLHTDECRASLYAFGVLQAARKKKQPTGTPRPVSHLGVVGGGLMATQLAVVFAEHLNATVTIIDLDQERVDGALARIQQQLDKAVERGRIHPRLRANILSRVRGTTRIAELAESDFVIEAVFEDLAVKRQVWASVEAVVSADCILLTNTSGLSITAMAEGLHHPERLIGFHFFNPVAVLPLVEIVRSDSTSERVIAEAVALAQAIGKTTVLVKDHPGFVVNRLLTRLFSDVLILVDGGADLDTVDRALVTDSLPLTPLALIGFIGPAVQLHILAGLHAAYPDRFVVSPSLTAIVDGRLGGYLGRDGRPTAEVKALLSSSARTALPSGMTSGVTGAQARDFILRGIADEVDRMLADGTVATGGDIDACLILGANFPQHTGGIIPLLDRSGASVATRGTPFLPAGTASIPVATAAISA